MSDNYYFEQGHRAILPYGCLTFWNEHSACKGHEQWTRCEVYVTGRTGAVRVFELQDTQQGTLDISKYEIRVFLHTLDLIFEAGKQARSLEVRKLLGM